MRQKILHRLCNASGGYVSGNELAESMGISRVAVWKHIEALKAEGYDISGTSGRGYTLKNRNNIIIPDQIKKSLDELSIVNNLKHFSCVDSTNKAARRLLEKGQIEAGTLITTNLQTEGKGRRGRQWESPAGGLAFSLVIKPPLPIHQIPLLSLVFAVAVCQGLNSFLSQPCQIKWPNDVYAGGKKVVGILLELSGELDRPDYVIAGIGINVNTSREQFSEDVQNLSGSLHEIENSGFSLTSVLVEVLRQLDHYYGIFLQEGFGEILSEFKNNCWHLGQPISLNQGGRVISGINTDIDENGSLLIYTGGKIEKLSTGDVSVI